MKKLIGLIIFLMSLAFALLPEKSFSVGKDTIPPKITLYGLVHDSIPLFNNYVDPGYAVSDNYSTNIKVVITGTLYSDFPGGKNINKVGNYTVIYTATDSPGNVSTAERFVKVYYAIPPVVSLKGPYNVSVCQYSVYNDMGYTVSYYDTTLLKIDTLGSFYKNGSSTAIANKTYTIYYEAKDTSSGNNSISATRVISILPSGTYPCNSSINLITYPGIDLKIYPNPASENVYIDAGKMEIKDVKIIDELGRIVLNMGHPDEGILQILVSQLNSGIYTIIFDSQNGSVTRQFVKD